jgi:hypothetical protein
MSQNPPPASAAANHSRADAQAAVHRDAIIIRSKLSLYGLRLPRYKEHALKFATIKKTTLSPWRVSEARSFPPPHYPIRFFAGQKLTASLSA